MIPEIVDAVYNIMAVYFYWTEGRYAKKTAGERGGDCVQALGRISVNLKDIKAASYVVEQANMWRKKLEAKYTIGQLMDDDDCENLGDACWEWYNRLRSIGIDMDSNRNTLESIEERIKKFEKGFGPLVENMQGLMTKLQTSTINFVESSPTVRSLEPILRGLFKNAASGDLMLAGYFDQYLLKDFQAISARPLIRFISPELTASKQDQINLDALDRLSKMGAEVRFHPMLHARMALSATEIIVGSEDLKSDCLGGRRYDAGIWTNNPLIIRSGKAFFDKVWGESKKL
jgi:hypothetical protein